MVTQGTPEGSKGTCYEAGVHERENERGRLRLAKVSLLGVTRERALMIFFLENEPLAALE